MHKAKIIKSRAKGLGGSDSRMILKVGRKGIESLSETDKRRLAVALKQIEFEETFTTNAMSEGNNFEDWVSENIYTEKLGWLNNERLESESIKPKNFRIFAHSDFINNNNIVIEAKYTKSDLSQTISDYIAQLQYYYMLGANEVRILKGTQGIRFDDYEEKAIDKDESVIKDLLKGIQLIDDFCDTFIYEPKDEWSVTDLLPFEQQDAQLMHNYLSEIKELQEKADYHKQRLLETLIENNVKSLKSDNYTLTVVPEGITSRFDKAKLFKENPDLNESDYVKQSKRSAYLKISLK